MTISALRVLIVCCNGGLFLAGELLVLKTALGVSNSHRRRILNRVLDLKGKMQKMQFHSCHLQHVLKSVPPPPFLTAIQFT